jgi:penicillin-binding protein 2
MIGNFKNENIISRRAVIAGGLKLSVFGIIASRLFNLQVLNGKKYKLQADGNRIRLSLICPDRGKILDCNNEILAENDAQFRLIFDGAYRDYFETSIPIVSEILDLDPEAAERLEEKYTQIRINNQTVIIDSLSWEQLVKLELNSHKLMGVEVMEGSNRYYPFGIHAPHLVGYVGYYSGQDIDNNPLLRHPDFRLGKDGIEKIFENELRGEAGLKRTEVNAKGTIIREISTDIPKQGDYVKLTIDIKLQKFIDELLPDTGSSAVVMDVTNGEIKALVSKPGFDPNELVKPKISSDYWNEIIGNKALPLINKTVATHYPPGSIFKIITVLAGLESGIKPDVIHNCPGYYLLGNREFRCAKKGGHGPINMRQALQYSCNVYMFHLAKIIGIDKISYIAKQMGLGSKTGIELPGELEGLAPNKRWKRENYERDWTLGDTLNSAIGQGFSLATPLQMALITARIANGGLLISPKLISDNEPANDRVKIKDKNLKFIQQAMFDAVNAPGGTGWAARVDAHDFLVAGKTATSQVVSKKQTKVKVDLSAASTAWESKNHAIFAGFAPYHNPKYAVTVLIEHGGNGSTGAAPFVGKIFRWLQQNQ